MSDEKSTRVRSYQRVVAGVIATKHRGSQRTWSLSARIGFYTGPREINGCRLWTGAKDDDGYALLKIKGRNQRVARALLGLKNGDPRTAMHSCDTPPCVEPSHVSRGTLAKNNADRAQKKRSRPAFGERSGAAKATANQVVEARALRAEGASLRSLASRLGLAYSTVRSMVTGKTWRSVK